MNEDPSTSASPGTRRADADLPCRGISRKDHQPVGSALEVFAVFLKLGLTSFGGPIAHLGYFRDEIVVRRKWLDDRTYADLVALCQFLPGPASSQVGLAIGLIRGGRMGALAAFVGFTMPSALLLYAFAIGANKIAGQVGLGVLHGLKIVAVAIVAQAVLGMARTLAPDAQRASIAVAAVFLLAFVPGSATMALAIGLGALAGLTLTAVRPVFDGNLRPAGISRRMGLICLFAFLVLFAGLPVLAPFGQGIAMFDAFYRAGALVFGGGHVVLPLLQTEVVSPGWVGEGEFLAGYAAAQAVPGPLFAFAAYLGAVSIPAPNGAIGALIALGSLFLPGFLILLAALPYWDNFRRNIRVQAAMRGANAAVVGILATALYDPVFTSAVKAQTDFALALACFFLLTAWKRPPWMVVLIGAAGGAALATI